MNKGELLARTLQWLYPGLKIKRWLLLAMAGLGTVLLGFTLFAGPEVLYFFGKTVVHILSDLRGTVYGLLILIAGLAMIVLGLQRATAAAGEALRLRQGKPLIEVLFARRYLESGPRVVAVGGGTGLSNLLRELKEYTSNLTAVVTVTDDGGSSGRLRGEMGILPPGDLRSCLLAMADTEPLMEKLFQHRFSRGTGLEGHSFGNLLIAAMTEMFGFQEAVKRFGQILVIRGSVLPVTLEMVRLIGEDTGGNLIRGQAVLNDRVEPLRRVHLDPPAARPLPEVLKAIGAAEVIVLGPGSLFSSVLPNLLVPGVTEAIRRSRAIKFYVCNVATQPGETTGFTAADHLQAVFDHTASRLVDYIIVNSDLSMFQRKPAHPGENAQLVYPDLQRLRKMGTRIISAPLLSQALLTQHHGGKLAALIMERAMAHQAGDKWAKRGKWRYRYKNAVSAQRGRQNQHRTANRRP